MLVARFAKKKRLLGELSRADVVSAYGAGEDDGFYFLVLAYVAR